jgi:hypothetical protein
MKRRLKIYADTNLWNLLCDRGDAQKVLASLNANNATLVLGFHTIYELAKTFRNPTDDRIKRGKELFSYLKLFVDHDIPCSKDNAELLAAEMWALKLRTPTVDVFHSSADFAVIKNEVALLANGILSGTASSFINERIEFASNTRANQISHLEIRDSMKQRLKEVHRDRLADWLNAETFSSAGHRNLTHQIANRFPGLPEIDLQEYATALLQSSNSRMAKGLVRADLYYNWRCANRGSNPKDLIDDMFHVLNSTYCDVYATEEQKQTEYAGLLLTPDTRVAIYDGAVPVDVWLAELTSKACQPFAVAGA